ncbi:MAG TPA: DUF433 domain-containing protein [Thermoanaerobaculia bacterium]
MPSARITVKPGLCGGKPTIRGLRVTVASILELMAGGMTNAEILADYPYLEAEDLAACLEYAADLASHRHLLFAEPALSS